ncbi:MAG: 2-isopropylmalate synthase, partial [Oscillospiraceae bacterium]|nr:2-isopropylmalate synthase [Oscillospiraceae bacterium]
KALGIEFTNLTYTEHALEEGSASAAVSYVSVTMADGTVSWGAGVDNDIIASSVIALFSAINRYLAK